MKNEKLLAAIDAMQTFLDEGLDRVKAADKASFMFNLSPKDADWLLNQSPVENKTVISLSPAMQITIQTIGKSGSITSTGLKNTEPMEEEDNEYNAAIDGLESLLLAMACEGVDLSTPQMRAAIKTAVEQIANNA